MKELNRVSERFTDSVIRRMTRISYECGAINLAQGYPDFDPPRELTDRLAEISGIGPHQYAITMGAPNFRQALARKCGRCMGRMLDPEKEIVVTIGSTEAMVDTLFALTNPGDKVILFSPYFENYTAQLQMVGVEAVFVPLVPPAFGFDPNVLEDAFRQDVKAILVCNPSNPTGKVFTEAELSVIAELAVRYDAYVIMDEVYEHIVYTPHRHVYMNSLPGMWERTVSCSSLSKTYSITGWRLGYAIAPEYIMKRVKQYHDFNAVGAAAPLMEAAIAGLEMPDSYYDGLAAHYAHMKRIFTGGLDSVGIPYTDPQGAYFVLADIGPYLKPGQSDVDFCERLAREVGVACVPGTSFFREDVSNIIRLHFAKKDETLIAAVERLGDIRRKLG
ncbi:MAG TPA: aminotransferase class I/II-fold pyridoxal phosphate-dependent enzyme [Clostridia bacterium]|nr:aminotransferase class I/II-fold pyridoxal phosphate-dependent enzyme [Clostridia bacterium]